MKNCSLFFGTKVTHLAEDIEEFAKTCGKVVHLTPTAARKGVANAVAMSSTDATKCIVNAHI